LSRMVMSEVADLTRDINKTGAWPLFFAPNQKPPSRWGRFFNSPFGSLPTWPASWGT